MMEKETLSVIAVGGAITTGRVSRNTQIQHARIRGIPFVRPGWAMVRPKPGKLTSKWPIEIPENKSKLLDTNQPNSQDIVSETVSPSTISSDYSEMSSSTVVPLSKYMQSHIVNDRCDLTEDESFLLEPEKDDTHDEPSESPRIPPCSCHGFLLGNCPTRIQNVLEIAKNVSESGQANRDHIKHPVGFLNTTLWKEKLSEYEDREDVLNGIEFGWELGRKEEPTLVSTFRNHQSADENSESIEEYIKDELADGNLVGPLPNDHGLDIIISPMGSVPKPGSMKRRTIVDSSFPPGHGVNDSIPKNMYRDKYIKVNLPTVEDIVAGIRRAKLRFPGHKLLGYKLDLSKYYRFLTTCPRDWQVQCIRWKGKVYMDTVWSFGLRSAVQAAQRTSSAVKWMFQNENISDLCPVIREHLCLPDSFTDDKIMAWMENEEIWNYIDDFIGISPDFLAHKQWEKLQKLVTDLGLLPSATPGHLVEPTECFVGLGIEFNMTLNLRRIPDNKLERAKQLLNDWRSKSCASRLELQQLLGILNHMSGCILSGRLFVSRMLSDLREAYKIEPRRVQLSQGFRKDLKWWQFALENSNGLAILDHKRKSIRITMDGSTKGEVGGRPGIGAFNFETNEYFHTPIPKWFPEMDIADYELLVHVIVGIVWGPSWRGIEVDGYTDNQATQHLLNHGRSHSDVRLNLAREFWWQQSQYDFKWNSLYINTKNNVLSDCLSRWGDSKLRKLFYEKTEDLSPREIFIPENYFHFKFKI